MWQLSNFSLSDGLHQLGQIMKVPCLVVLAVLIVVAVWQLGDLLMELITERRCRERDVEGLLERLHEGGGDQVEGILDQSRLPKSQKRMLRKLAQAKSLTHNERMALAQKFLEDEEGRYERRTAVPDLLAKLGPMFGLLGTLIPLGPGIVALGQGDTATLSSAIGLAFDTTICGLLAAAVGSVVSNVRTRWYDGAMADFEAVMEYVLEEAGV
jgi:biopolymer transport protein ExbB/TolQ